MNRTRCSAILLAAAGLLFLTSPSRLGAQRYVDVPAGYGTLQSIIRADSVNRAANPNTIYRVHRGSIDSVYYLTSTLDYWGSMQLNIQSFGTGPLPRFVMATISDGTPITPIIYVRKNLSLKGVSIEGKNTLGVTADRIIRIQDSAATLTLDSVHFANSAQSFIRVDGKNARIHLKNCRVSNIFSDFSNARGVDNRGVTIDTLIMEGCSFYRIASRVYRDGGGILTYGFFNHNTFVDIGTAVLQLGSTVNITYTNNLSVNGQFIGTGQSAAGRLIGISAVPGLTVHIFNNVFYADTAALYAAYHTSSDTVAFPGWFADTLASLIASAGLSGTNISSPVTFTIAPWDIANAIKVDSIARWYWRNPTVNSSNSSMVGIDSIKFTNLAYNTDAPAYTFGSDGKPAGASEWFGISITGVVPGTQHALPADFSLEHNYPNPFNPSTAIGYSLPRNGNVRLVVYDLFGREVRTLVEGHQSAGRYRTTFDARGLASGAYFCCLSVDGVVVVTNKMLLMK